MRATFLLPYEPFFEDVQTAAVVKLNGYTIWKGREGVDAKTIGIVKTIGIDAFSRRKPPLGESSFSFLRE